jgi:hypothetical protein
MGKTGVAAGLSQYAVAAETGVHLWLVVAPMESVINQIIYADTSRGADQQHSFHSCLFNAAAAGAFTCLCATIAARTT